MCFIGARLRREAPLSDLCVRHGISRKTANKWLVRYRSGGLLDLQDRSRARPTQSQAIDAEIDAAPAPAARQAPRLGPAQAAGAAAARPSGARLAGGEHGG